MTHREQLLSTIAELELRRAELATDLLVERLRGGDPRRVSQQTSPLGRRRHIAAVERRIEEEQAAGELPGTRGAYVVGRKYLLTQEALAEELGRGTRGALNRLVKGPRKPTPANDAAESDVEDELLAKWSRRQ